MTTFLHATVTNMPTKSASCHLSHIVAVTVVVRLIPYYNDYVSIDTVQAEIFKIEHELFDLIPINLDLGHALLTTIALLEQHDIKISARRR